MGHAPRLLTHGNHAEAGGFSGGEVDVSQLGESVADLIVDSSLRDFATFDVGDGNAQGQRNGSGRHHLIAVGDEQQQVWTPGGERVSQAEDGDADGLGHAGVGVGAEQALDARENRKSVALNFRDCVAELRRQMRAQCEDAQFHARMCGQFTQRPVEMAVVGARGGDDADAALVLRFTHQQTLAAFSASRAGDGRGERAGKLRQTKFCRNESTTKV